MRQRVNLARAFAVHPDILLMDEPFASLDALTRETMQQELFRIVAETKKTVLFITHQIEEAVFLADRIAVFSARPAQLARIIEVDPVTPARAFDRCSARAQLVEGGELDRHAAGAIRPREAGEVVSAADELISSPLNPDLPLLFCLLRRSRPRLVPLMLRGPSRARGGLLIQRRRRSSRASRRLRPALAFAASAPRFALWWGVWELSPSWASWDLSVAWRAHYHFRRVIAAAVPRFMAVITGSSAFADDDTG